MDSVIGQRDQALGMCRPYDWSISIGARGSTAGDSLWVFTSPPPRSPTATKPLQLQVFSAFGLTALYIVFGEPLALRDGRKE